MVDVIAIRKDTLQPEGRVLKRGDLFDIILIQIKGGSARGPTAKGKRRLRDVKRHYHAREVVQFQWRKGKIARFSLLPPNSDEWEDSAATEIFG